MMNKISLERVYSNHFKVRRRGKKMYKLRCVMVLEACSLELNWLGFSYKKHQNFADILVEYTLWKVKIYKLLVYISLKKLEKKSNLHPEIYVFCIILRHLSSLCIKSNDLNICFLFLIWINIDFENKVEGYSSILDCVENAYANISYLEDLFEQLTGNWSAVAAIFFKNIVLRGHN